MWKCQLEYCFKTNITQPILFIDIKLYHIFRRKVIPNSCICTQFMRCIYNDI